MSNVDNMNLSLVSPDNNLGRYLDHIKKFPMLEAGEEYSLAKDWLEKQDTKAAHKLVTSHLRLVAKIAMGYRGYGLPIADLIAEGNIGMMHAVKKFDPEKGFRLATYAMWWIKASIQEYILRSWSLVKIGTTTAQKKLFFNLKKLKNQIAPRSEGELRDEHVTEIAKKLEKSLADNYSAFEKNIGMADGFQCTGVGINDLHHTANVTYNVLRGGIFFDNYTIKKNSFELFLQKRSKKTFEAYQTNINQLPDSFNIKDLLEFGDKLNKPSIRRLCREYLPLTLGRRHGDPSRPWNHFNFLTKDINGDPVLYFEGNWRDIFQNWEALGLSYPNSWESMVSIFLNATSADGYNPYRITSYGIDWEIIEPDDSWSHIGYWNDHQIIYLLKLLEVWKLIVLQLLMLTAQQIQSLLVVLLLRAMTLQCHLLLKDQSWAQQLRLVYLKLM